MTVQVFIVLYNINTPTLKAANEVTDSGYFYPIYLALLYLKMLIFMMLLRLHYKNVQNELLMFECKKSILCENVVFLV